ncbi:hypothetical protein ARC23_08260 [Stenotrophomonas beteli]|uniref:Uncharacterized protein n=2 Tax=Stenotrophomonas beteli TaxID=3384461 RepID=A0A0R0BCX3_9GAMM|nr:hypothetical protein ARC23_08260 [Stenotrophomonas maltophilia]
MDSFMMLERCAAAGEGEWMNKLAETLESRLTDGSGVYVSAGGNSRRCFDELAEDIRRNACQPFELSAVVMAPGIPGFDEGEEISGLCVAKEGGRWLVYRPEDDLFYAFWGPGAGHLGAHGVFGSPLYCWSA